MSLPKRILYPVFLFSLLSCASLSGHAQLEVTRLMTKGFSATGFGTFLHFGIPVSQAGEITGEAGFYYFASGGQHAVMVPFLAGYRHFFDGTGTGFYAEPAAGYNLGATDIQRVDSLGDPMYDGGGNEVDRKISGFTGAMTLGYIIPSPNFPINFGLRYQHVFVSGGEPSASLLSLRISWSLNAGRRQAEKTGQ